MIRVTGVEDIDKVLRGLPKQIEHKVLQAAYADAAKPTVSRAYYAAPLLSGGTAESIGIIKTPVKRANAVGEIQIGPRRGKRYKGHKAHWFEFGARKVQPKGGGEYPNRGVIKKKPFMRPAWESTKGQVLSSIQEKIGKKLYQFMKKTIKNA